MKKSKRLILLGAILAALVFVFPQTVSAASNFSTVIKDEDGGVIWGESKDYTFAVPVESKVRVVFDGECYNDGEYNLIIKDSSGNIVFSKSGLLVYSEDKDEDVVITTVLKSGNYVLSFTCPDEAESNLNYGFYVQTSPNVPVPATRIKLNKSTVNLSIDDFRSLKATLYPTYATDSVKWSSSNSKVVKVSKSGGIHARNLGTATITAKVGKKTAKCKVVVKNAYNYVPLKKTISAVKWVKYIKGYKSAKWSSSKKSVATVKNGKITGKKGGETTITAKIKGVKYKIKVYVYDPNATHSGGGSGD